MAAKRLVYRAMASEEDEVRALLQRHRKQIIRDVNESELVTVLTQKGVLSATNQKQLTEIQTEKYNKFIGLNNVSTPIIKNLTDSASNGFTSNGGSVSETIKSNIDNEINDLDEKKCTFLIDVIARNGFEKFKEFCYAIERECPKLIEDLIADRLSGGKWCFSVCFCSSSFWSWLCHYKSNAMNGISSQNDTDLDCTMTYKWIFYQRCASTCVLFFFLFLRAVF